MEMLKNGRGNKDHRVNSTLTRSMEEMARINRKIRSRPYKMVGPRNIRTFDTSSEMRDIRSPVALRL